MSNTKQPLPCSVPHRGQQCCRSPSVSQRPLWHTCILLYTTAHKDTSHTLISCHQRAVVNTLGRLSITSVTCTNKILYVMVQETETHMPINLLETNWLTNKGCGTLGRKWHILSNDLQHLSSLWSNNVNKTLVSHKLTTFSRKLATKCRPCLDGRIVVKSSTQQNHSSVHSAASDTLRVTVLCTKTQC